MLYKYRKYSFISEKDKFSKIYYTRISHSPTYWIMLYFKNKNKVNVVGKNILTEYFQQTVYDDCIFYYTIAKYKKRKQN